MSTVVGLIHNGMVYVAADTQLTNIDGSVSDDVTQKLCNLHMNVVVGATGHTDNVYPLFRFLTEKYGDAPLNVEIVQQIVCEYYGEQTSHGLIMIAGVSQHHQVAIVTASFSDLSSWKVITEPDTLVILPPENRSAQECESEFISQHSANLVGIYPLQICRLAVRAIADISPYVNKRCTVWQLGDRVVTWDP